MSVEVEEARLLEPLGLPEAPIGNVRTSLEQAQKVRKPVGVENEPGRIPVILAPQEAHLGVEALTDLRVVRREPP